MIRLLVDGRGHLRKEILDRMVARSGGRVEIAVHFGDRDGDYHAPSLQRMEVRYGKQGHLMQNLRLRGADLPMLAAPEFRQMLETAVDQFHRMSPAYRYRGHNLQNLQDYLDYFHILAEAYAQKIEETGATHALFMNMPHLGYDWVLYQVAQAMGLKTIVLCQTIFPDLYFSVNHVEDLGLFDGKPTEAPAMLIEKGTSPDLFYMDPRWQKESPRGRINSRAVVNLIKHLALRAPLKLLSPRYLRETLGRMKSIYAQMPDWRDPFATFFHENELAYFEHLAEYERAPVDYDANFIYAPLHNQPEMSTSTLGGHFRDQVLMIEALSHNLPEGWRIYVKENPRQGAFARGPMFYHRLARIRGVQLVPSNASTHELSARARFTATVTGTAGWESLRKGRPAVIFGAAWYKSLPGAFMWSSDLDFHTVAATTFSHEDLERAAGALVERCHPGVIETIYLKIAKDFDPARNVETVSETLLDLIEGRTPVTFGAP